MGQLFLQSWLWMLIAFVVGALIALAIIVLTVPNEDKAFAELNEKAARKVGRI